MVVVTINYRLGLLGVYYVILSHISFIQQYIIGFLSLEDPSLEVPGNAGLKDMVMALQWVQRNIAYFSGNPHNVTIFGQSAGAGAVEYLTLSPLTKGWLPQYISQGRMKLFYFRFVSSRNFAQWFST